MTVRNLQTNRNDPPLLNEARLVDQAKSGDPEAFARLYDAYVERVSRYIYFRVSEETDMDDLVS